MTVRTVNIAKSSLPEASGSKYVKRLTRIRLMIGLASLRLVDLNIVWWLLKNGFKWSSLPEASGSKFCLPRSIGISFAASSLPEASGSKSLPISFDFPPACLASLRLVDLNIANHTLTVPTWGLASLRLVDLNCIA